MPIQDNNFQEYSEEVNEIITAVPSWILKRGITVIFLVLSSIVLMSAFIRYPDIIKTTLKVNSLNAPKEVIAHQQGKLVKILVQDGQLVENKQPLAFIESTARHEDVLIFAKKLKLLRELVNDGKLINGLSFQTKGLNLGELQNSYQAFNQEYIQFTNTQSDGFLLAQKKYLQKDLNEIQKLQEQILEQKQIQEKEYANAEEEYESYRKLKKGNVISNSEFRQQENKYLSSKYPLQQTKTELLRNKSSFLDKQKELAVLENTIREQQAKFIQALNSIISDTEMWLIKYIALAPLKGRLTYVGILQQDQNLTMNQPLFIINPGNSNFFGEVQIPQYNMGKVKEGEQALVKLKSYPHEQYGIIRGRLAYVSDVAFHDSVFVAKVSFEHFENKDPNKKIVLKNGMQADVEIITEEGSLLQRFFRNMIKLVNGG